MSTPTPLVTLTLSLPACPSTTATIPYNPPGILALGPSIPERDILLNCCHATSTTPYYVNDTACAQSGVCAVQECSLADPTFMCVARMREVWGVEGVFGCGRGVRGESGAGRVVKGMGKWMVVVIAGCAIAGLGMGV